MTHSYRCPVRWGDMDAQGHVNNAAFVDYLQEARVDFLHAGPPVMRELLDSGVIVAGHQVEYLAPVVYTGRPLTIDLWLEAVGGSRFKIGYEIRDGAEVAVRARTTATPFDLTNNALRRLTAAEREYLTAHLEPAEPLRPVDSTKIKFDGSGRLHRVRVRWSDLDSYGHVNNVRYYDYVQEARVEFVADLIGGDDGGQWVVVRQDLDYLKPVDFAIEPYLVETVVTKIGTRSVSLAAELRDDAGTRYATARTVLVGDRPITEDWRAFFERRSGRVIVP
ncbi:acyl-CoA thioesterase [Microlunatus speluncae]|uniref:acyl-CoA thioesterase n=1 Tax=Microlunatus speluncae TaxID=2594267 RepID=UPI0012663EE1|nr:thioesterase family protein [Microlunatus speluncae]